MKHIIFVLSLLAPLVAYAAEEKKPVDLAELAKIVDPSTKTEKIDAPKVADKALNMFQGAVHSVVEGVAKVAPEVWRVMVKQQYATALTRLAIPIVGIILSLIYIFALALPWKKKYLEVRDEEAFAYIFFKFIVPGIMVLVFCILLLTGLNENVPKLINPEYYAIRDMFLIALGK